MRGVTEEVLVATVDFLYNGEENIYQERLKGLTGDFTEGNTSQGPSHVKSPSGEDIFPKRAEELEKNCKASKVGR